jgi:TctA family transporter
MFILILPVAVLALHIFLMVWVARDCKARGQREIVGWLILLALTGLIGLIVYLCVRPSGPMLLCAKCGRRYMKSLEACPHCRS